MSKLTELLKNPRTFFEFAPHPEAPPAHAVEPDSIDHPDHPDNDSHLEPLPDEPAEDAEGLHGTKPTNHVPGVVKHLEPLKKLAKTSLPLIQHLVALKQAYIEDPQLNSKEAKTEMAAIMALIFREDEAAVYFFGQVLFDPNVGSFIALFDDIGSQKLGPYLGIDNLDQLPGKAPATAPKPGAHPAPAPAGPVPAPGAPGAPAHPAPKLPQL